MSPASRWGGIHFLCWLASWWVRGDHYYQTEILRNHYSYSLYCSCVQQFKSPLSDALNVLIIPCEPIQLRLPITSSETNANYGGIAGYAFGIEPLHSSVCSQSLSTIPIIPLFSFIHISIKTEMMIHTDSNEREKNSIETSQRVPHTGTNSTRNDLAS